jgi:formylglycine-generating enzyme required for sulfatase activity
MTTNTLRTTLVELKGKEDCSTMEFVWIEPGCFRMGASDDEPANLKEERPPFRVELTQGFWIGRYPVTQSQWMAIMSTNPSFHSNEPSDCPVENVSWHDAASFCAGLNSIIADTFPGALRAQLPWESQWEYACRAGTSTIFYSGDSEHDLDRIAWYAGNSDGKTHPVGLKEPNAWGLHDMVTRLIG